MLKKSVIAAASLGVSALRALVVTAPAADAATGMINCTALHTKWKHGVGKSTAHDKTSGIRSRTSSASPHGSTASP